MTYRESLEAVHRNADQMTRAVETLLTAARQEAAGVRPTSDAREGVRAAVEAVRDDGESVGMQIRLSVPPRPVAVAIESGLLERIVHPLLDNAVRYGRTQVSVDVRVSGTSAFVEVADDGAGLDPGETDTVFEPGARGSAAIADPAGTGLGLALARRLARSAGGEIVASASDSGGRFSVRLPLA